MPQVIKWLDSLFKLSLEQHSPEKESTSFQDRENEETSLIHRNVPGTRLDQKAVQVLDTGALAGGLCDTNLSMPCLDTNSPCIASKEQHCGLHFWSWPFEWLWKHEQLSRVH